MGTRKSNYQIKMLTKLFIRYKILRVNANNKKITRALDCYHSGEFKTARELCCEIIDAENSSEQTVKQAQQIIKATGIDYMAIIVFAGSGLVLLFLILRYIF